MNEDRHNEHTQDIAMLKKGGEMNERAMIDLRDKVHDMNNTLALQTGSLSGIGKTMTSIAQRLEHHMDNEEEVTKNIYERLRSLDKELKDAFKERDKRMNDIEKTQVKFGVYMAGAAFAISAIVQIVMRGTA